jgi:hypothetical protein
MLGRNRSIGTGSPPREAIRSFKVSKEDSETTSNAVLSAKPTVPWVTPFETRS